MGWNIHVQDPTTGAERIEADGLPLALAKSVCRDTAHALPGCIAYVKSDRNDRVPLVCQNAVIA